MKASLHGSALGAMPPSPGSAVDLASLDANELMARAIAADIQGDTAEAEHLRALASAGEGLLCNNPLVFSESDS